MNFNPTTKIISKTGIYWNVGLLIIAVIIALLSHA